MKDTEQLLKDNYAPNNKRWSASALDAWEAKVAAEIDTYLLTPCEYYGPDLDF